MENKNLMLSIDKLPLIEEAFASIENMEKFCNKILESRLAPDHFYPKLPGSNDRDYTKGNTPAVMMVLIQGNQLHLPVLTALQQIVPVNGLLSIKGDGAKSIILNSGKVQLGSWVEKEEGSIEDGTFKLTITAQRSDTKETMSRSFSVAHAKRAGLWVTESMVNSQDGWKWKKSAWYKFPERMIKYRALGFLARDLFPDVMAGTYTTEEAMDIPQETTEVIETDKGARITIQDKQHAKQRAGRLTERVAEKIPENKYKDISEMQIEEVMIVGPERQKEISPEVQLKTSDKDESPFIPSKGSVEYFDGKAIKVDGMPYEEKPPEGKYTDDQLSKMETINLLQMVNDDMDMMDAMETIPGKNTNKKLRGIILAHQEGTLFDYVASLVSEKSEEKQEEKTEPEPEKVDPGVNDDMAYIKPNKEFDKQSEAPEKTKEQFNKYALDIPDFDKGDQREFGTKKNLYNLLLTVDPAINNNRYLELAEKIGMIEKYKDKETFCGFATKEEINILLNSN